MDGADRESESEELGVKDVHAPTNSTLASGSMVGDAPFCGSREDRPGEPSPDGNWTAFVRDHNLWLRAKHGPARSSS